ncbi:hypothetical protein HPB51_009476 [Rhipicephalus microplus]|uniref:Uncharacterized protein n=1 Tax=Rhipicephalus microplus TaxID=6941 RepID=A0A9J6DV03_RHIMP|nr:hypothetical protein HPB51_009476 [Rhipicephalus microplus]
MRRKKKKRAVRGKTKSVTPLRLVRSGAGRPGVTDVDGAVESSKTAALGWTLCVRVDDGNGCEAVACNNSQPACMPRWGWPAAIESGTAYSRLLLLQRYAVLRAAAIVATDHTRARRRRLLKLTIRNRVNRSRFARGLGGAPVRLLYLGCTTLLGGARTGSFQLHWRPGIGSCHSSTPMGHVGTL